MMLSKQISKIWKNHRLLCIVLLSALALRLFYFFRFHEVWWDAGVYFGMGKYLLSGGSGGLWEHIRPPLWPVFLGLLWRLRLPLVMSANIIQLLMSLGIVVLVYALGLEYSKSRRVGAFAAAIAAFSPIMLYSGFHAYAEVPCIFFALLGLWLFEKGYFVISGMLMAAAFLSKYPAGIFFAVPLAVLAFRRKFYPALKICIGFGIVSLPFFLASFLLYGSPFAMMLAASESISKVLGCNVLRFKPWWHYFYLAVFVENPLSIFALIGISLAVVKRRAVPLLALALPLAYFSSMHCRDYRYFILLMPFCALFAGWGIDYAVSIPERHVRSKKLVLMLAFAVVLLVSAGYGEQYYHGNERFVLPAAEMNYFLFAQSMSAEKEVWTANPIIAAYTDIKLNKIYYPLAEEGAGNFLDYVRTHADSLGYVFIDNCGGGLVCANDDDNCSKTVDSLKKELSSRLSVVYNATDGVCNYLIFRGLAV